MIESIKKSSRRITKLNFCLFCPSEMQIQTTLSIIENFSFIKYLRLETNFLHLSDFLEILAALPNAEHLKFKNLSSNDKERYGHQPVAKRRCTEASTEDLNLHRLKKLICKHCKLEYVTVFNRLPAGVLIEFTLDNRELNDLSVLFKRQTNLKTLTVIEKYTRMEYVFPKYPIIDANIFDGLQLESIRWDHKVFRYIETMVSKQPKAKSLRLCSESVSGELIEVIVKQLPELETLEISVPYVPIASFLKISKLKNLKHLALRNNDERNMIALEHFSKLNNSRLTILDIRYIIDISYDLLSKIARSVPNLKVLFYTCDSKYTTFNVITRNFKTIEKLQLDIINYYFGTLDRSDHNNDLLQGNGYNPNMTELLLYYTLPYATAFITKLIADYPNLKKLSVEALKPFTAEQFKAILTGFPKLESLSLVAGASELTMDDLGYITEHKNNLKFIALEDLHLKYTAGLKKRLFATFDVVNVRNGLAMAINVETLIRERECVF